MGGPCKNRVRAGIGGSPGTATGGQIHVVHISHTHPPKEIIQALRKYLLGKMRVVEDDTKTEDAIPFWKIDDFLHCRFSWFFMGSWVWVVFKAARAKKVETKRFYTPPLGGKKTQAFLVAPQKGSFVGWLVI